MRLPLTSWALLLLWNVVVSVEGLSSPPGRPKKKFNGGAGVGRLVIDERAGLEGAVQCHYDMVLCERVQGPVGGSGT